MSSSPAPSQSHTAPRSIQLPRELWCAITAYILADYFYHLIIHDEDENEHTPVRCRPSYAWDDITVLLHISRLVRSCTFDHLAFLCAPRSYEKKDNYDEYALLVTHLQALRDGGIVSLMLEEWDYAPGARFFGLTRSLAGPYSCEEEANMMPPVLVLARLRLTLAASDLFAVEGWDWFPFDAPEVYDARCTALLVDTYRAVPAYVRGALLGRVVERIAALQVKRIARAIEDTWYRIEMPLWSGVKHHEHIPNPVAKASSEDLLVSVRRTLATELNITL